MGPKPPRHHHPPDYHRDHARPRSALAPTTAAMEARLTELISPATHALTAEYHRLDLRWHLLSLLLMVALLLALISRQIPSVGVLLQILVRDNVLWVPRVRVSQQAFSQRLRALPKQLVQQVLEAVIPILQERATARSRPLPPNIQHALTHFPQLWALECTTLEELFHPIRTAVEVLERVLARHPGVVRAATAEETSGPVPPDSLQDAEARTSVTGSFACWRKRTTSELCKDCSSTRSTSWPSGVIPLMAER